MAVNNCDPCACIGPNISDVSFHQAALVVLCDILAELSGATGEDVNIVAVGGTAITLGQKSNALSFPVVSAETKAEDAAAVSGDFGFPVLAVQTAAPTSTAADGDYGWIKTDALGKLWGAGDQIEDTGHTTGDRGTFVLGVRNDASTTVVTTTNLDYSPIGVDDRGAVQIAIQRLEDSAHTSGDPGILALAIRNDAAATSLTTTDGDYSGIAVDIKGRIFTNPGSGADSLGKAEDSVAASGDVGVAMLAVQTATPASTAADGDYGWLKTDALGKLWTADTKVEDVAAVSGDIGSFILAVRNDSLGSLTTTDGDYSGISVDAFGRLATFSQTPGTGAGNLGKAEDAAHSSGDTGVFALGVRNTTAVTYGADQDYAPIAVGTFGQTLSTLIADSSLTQSTTPVRLEDSAHVSGDAGLAFWAVNNETLGTTFNTTNGDYTPISVDRYGRLSLFGVQGSGGANLLKDEDAVAASGDAGVMTLTVLQETLAASAAIGDYGSLKTNTLGALWTRPQIATVTSTGGSASSSGNNTIVAAGTNKLKVSSFLLSTSSNTAVTCIFQSGASGTELYRVTLQAGATGPAHSEGLAVPVPAWLFATGTATLLNLNLSGAISVSWSVTYVDEA